MRPDMDKVVTERPRNRHGAPSLKTHRRLHKDEFIHDDHGSARAPVSAFRQYGYDAKTFSDLIGPLRRYLRKQVGRPWNKVYSELSATLDRRSLSGRHIWQHVTLEVERYCEVREDGKVYRKEVQRYKTDRPVGGLYVHPTTRLLCYTQEKRYRFRPRVNPDEQVIDPLRTLRCIENIWYLFTYVEVVTSTVRYGRCALCPQRGPEHLRRDPVQFQPILHLRWTGHDWKGTTTRETKTERVFQHKRQLNRKELQQYHVSNTN